MHYDPHVLTPKISVSLTQLRGFPHPLHFCISISANYNLVDMYFVGENVCKYIHCTRQWWWC